jgi:hypothetical protein
LSVVFGSSICTATANNYTLGLKLFYWDFMEVTWVGECYNKKLGMWVIAEYLKKYVEISITGKNTYLQVVS